MDHESCSSTAVFPKYLLLACSRDYQSTFCTLELLRPQAFHILAFFLPTKSKRYSLCRTSWLGISMLVQIGKQPHVWGLLHVTTLNCHHMDSKRCLRVHLAQPLFCEEESSVPHWEFQSITLCDGRLRTFFTS